MASIKQIFGKTLAYGIIPKIPTAINMIILPIITPYLTLYDYGIWGIVSAYCSFFTCLAPLGLNMHLSNSYFEIKKWRIFWGHIYYILLLSGLICSVLYISIIMIELRYVPTWTRFLIALLSCNTILLFATRTISTHLYPLLSRPLPLVLRNLAVSLCTLTVTFIVVYYFRMGYWGWILGSFTGSLLGFILFSYTLAHNEKIVPLIERNTKRIKKWLKMSIPVIPHSIGMMLLVSSSRIIMSFYNLPLDDIGIFSNGFTMGDYITVVSTALATALAPEIQRTFRSSHFTEFRHIFYFCQMTALVFVFLIACWMPQIYQIFMRNPSLQIAAPIASMICFAKVLDPLYNFLAIVVFISKDTKHLLWLVFLPGILNVAICLIFIPYFGYMAAVYSSLISFWSMLLTPFISKFHKREVLKWLGTRKKLVFLAIVVISAFLISSVIKNLSICIKITISFIVGISYILTLYKNKSLRTF